MLSNFTERRIRGMGRLGQLLVEAGALEPLDLERGLIEHRRSGGKLGEVLVRLQLVTELQVTEALAEQLHLPVDPLDPLPTPEPDLLARIPATLALGGSILPLELQEQGRVMVVAVSGPLRGERLEQLRSHARCWILPRLAPESVLRRALEAAYDAPFSDGAPGLSDPAFKTGAVRAIHGGGGAAAEEQVTRPDLPAHPEVRALVELLRAKGLLSLTDLHDAFGVRSAPAPVRHLSPIHDKEFP